MRLLLLLALGLIVCGAIFTGARRLAMVSRRARTRTIVLSFIGIAAGAWVAFILPRRVPDTPGSPAMLVGVLALWFLGGSLLVLAVPSMAGAVMAKPPTEEGGA
jgi:hypothetical protein